MKLVSRKSLIVLLLGFLLSACLPKTSLNRFRPGESFDSSKDEALVFGKIVIIENGKERPYSSFNTRPDASLFQLESKEYFVGPEVSEDGSFGWRIPRGTYIISEIYSSAHDTYFVPRMSFHVPFEGEVFYIGTLKIDIEIEKEWFRVNIKKTNVTVEDESERAKEEFMQRNPNLSAKIEKSLAVHDGSIPVDSRLRRDRSQKGWLFFPLQIFLFL